MDKKKFYWIGGIIIVVLGYLNYFKDESTSKTQEKKIETTGAKYLGDGYQIEAGKQIDFVDKKENQFIGAKAKIKEMLLSGDNAFLDAAKNLALKTNILGTATNGWNFKADEIDYDKITDTLTSKKPVEAENKNLKIKVMGNNFKTDSKMSYLEIRDGVTIENDKMKVTGDSADYNDTLKSAIMKGNIKLAGKLSGEKSYENLTGDFTTLNFDLNNEILKSDEPFTLYYGQMMLSAGEFIFNQKNDTLDISKNVTIKNGNFLAKVQKIEKRSGSNVYDILGKIEGTDGIYSFISDRGEFDSDKNELQLIGDVKVTSTKKQNLSADNIIYNTESGVTIALGNKRDVIYKGPEGELETKKFKYDSKNEILNIDDKFRFKSQEYTGTGSSLIYNLASKEGMLKGADIISGTKVFKTTLIDLKEGMINFPEEFDIVDRKNGDKFNSKLASYNTATKIFKTDEKFNLVNGDTKITGTGIEYNDSTGFGVSNKGIDLKNDKDKLYLTADKAEFQNQKYMDLIGNINVDFGDYKTEAERARYNFSDEMIKIPQKIEVASKDGKGKSVFVNPEIDVKNSIMTGKNFTAQNERYNASSSQVRYEYKSEILNLKGNAVVSEGEMELRGENLKYQVKDEKMSAVGNYDFKYGEISGQGTDILFSNTSGAIKGGKIKFVTEKNEEFQSNKIDGNLQKQVVYFIGDAKGKTFSNGKAINYRGDLLRVHLKEIDKRYSAERVELIGDSVITQDGVTLYSKYGDVNLSKKIATATQGVRAVMVDEKKSETEVKGEKAVFNMNTDILDLTGGVTVTNIDPQKGKTVATAEKGVVDRAKETVLLQKDVVIDSPDAIVKADRCVYNLKTKKINATGNVVVDYKVKP